MEFRFINNNAPLDRRSQKLVRNHAMKGKNAGRVIPERGHRGQQQREGSQTDCLATRPPIPTEVGKGRALLPKPTSPDPGSGPDITLPPNPFAGAELAYFPLPVTVTPSVRYLLYEFHYRVSKELYPRVFCQRPRENAAVCVFVSISFALHANLRGSTGEGRIHLQGLKRILQLRPGGLAALCSGTPEVGNKARRADLELALSAGTHTLFGSQISPLPVPPYVVPKDNRRPRLTVPHPLDEASPVVQFAMTDVLTLCDYAGRAQLSAFQYQDLVLSITQRLNDLAPLGGERPSHPLDDLCQLGLLAFMGTLLNQTLDRRYACSALLSGLLRVRLDSFDSETAHGRASRYPALQLWLLLIYAVSAPEFEQYCGAYSFVAQRIRILASTLALETWEGVAAYLRLYPWVAAFHDEPGKKLWAVACRERCGDVIFDSNCINP